MKTPSKFAIGLLVAASMATAMAQTPLVKPSLAPAPHSDPGSRPKDLTRAEVLAKAAERFDRIDTNKDGVLTKEERRAEHQKMRGHRGAPSHHVEQRPPGAAGEPRGSHPAHGGGQGQASGAIAPQR